MTKETNKELDKEFGITDAEEVVDITPIESKIEPEKKKKEREEVDDKKKDYQYARAQLYDIVEKMQESLNDAMDVAAESQHPRAFEVVFNGAKNAADVVDKIGDLHKKMKDLEIEEVKVQQHNTTTNNIMMTGSTAELIKMLKDNKDK
jgi:hypothetical protein